LSNLAKKIASFALKKRDDFVELKKNNRQNIEK
jgi:hypothetical protein